MINKHHYDKAKEIFGEERMTADFNKYYDRLEMQPQATTLDWGEELIANVNKCLESEKNFHVSSLLTS